jgi:LPPG:FO 2-phospho-L-lactate transferase
MIEEKIDEKTLDEKKIVVITGGTGGAKFVDGLRQVMPPQNLTLIVNTGDDFEWWGLHISPDVDSITYLLGGLLSKERGWGVQSDTFFCLRSMQRMNQPAWFKVGDRDLAVHLLRSQLLREGKTLAEATAEIAASLGIQSRILPMSNSGVETRVSTPNGELSFQEYFVKRRYQDPVQAVRFAGAESAQPAPGVVEAILSADAVLLAPSNPVTSIGPILAVSGIREAVRKTHAPVAAISPIVGGAAVSGPAGALMTTQGLPVSIAGIAQTYEDFLDVLIADIQDAPAAASLRNSGLQINCTNTIMKAPDDRVTLARFALSAALMEEGVSRPSAVKPRDRQGGAALSALR